MLHAIRRCPVGNISEQYRLLCVQLNSSRQREDGQNRFQSGRRDLNPRPPEPHSHSGGANYGNLTVSPMKSGIGAGFHLQDDRLCREKRTTKRTTLLEAELRLRALFPHWEPAYLPSCA